MMKPRVNNICKLLYKKMAASQSLKIKFWFRDIKISFNPETDYNFDHF